MTPTAASNGHSSDQPWFWDDVCNRKVSTAKIPLWKSESKKPENPARMAYLLKGFEINEKIQAGFRSEDNQRSD